MKGPYPKILPTPGLLNGMTPNHVMISIADPHHDNQVARDVPQSRRSVGLAGDSRTTG